LDLRRLNHGNLPAKTAEKGFAVENPQRRSIMLTA
jgi:hypothetical protein